ncbi:sulfite dehydrogenase [Paracraurococcus lichenis]|uniref:Sulfite dehydrogenase n=1 Tax=Paracraurococcus lichenis TaxID=3064888 RepID=A0ABT9E408_9PROT|nr:sulfite dehydrogenase [Paracraurococcus sp. LOR1-02]MDO9710905.1 sulfite dehydrogenase [Paracraurococcus sp. LOR1-02]
MTRPGRLTRRRLAASALLAPGAAAAERLEVPPGMREQGAPLDATSYGLPAPTEQGVRRRSRPGREYQPILGTAGSIVTPLGDLDGIVTPNGLHFIRCHAGIPAIAPEQHRLLVHGLVERPLVFSMDQLRRFPTVSRLHFLECSGNSPLYRTARIRPDWTAQDTHGLLSCAEWTGLRLADLLAEVGVRPEARWMLAEGADAAGMTRSIPVAKALDDAMLCWAQNGEALRPEQGYPLRLFLPGYEGNTNVKWLRRLKLAAEPFMTREETSRYTGLLPDGTARQFNFTMHVKSVITRPSGGQSMGAPGFREISGIAWSGFGAIRRVEVSVDGGATWRDAALQDPVLPKCLTRFRLPWQWDGQPALLASRATDETGAVQPSREALLAEVGEWFTYHYNAILAWKVTENGTVQLAV